MKQLFVLVLMMVSFTCFAANPEMQMMGMDPAKMQQMQAVMKKMQDCMKKIDKSQMEQLKERSQVMGKQIDALCKAGKRAEAQSKAMAFASEIASSPAIIQMNKCTAQMRDIMPLSTTNDRFSEDNLKNKNVCDSNIAK